MAFFLESNLLYSPYVVPVAGCVAGLGIAVTAIWSGVRTREMQSQERLAAIARGLPLPPTIEELALTQGLAAPTTIRRSANTRRGGIVLLGIAGGLILFFAALSLILQVRAVLCGAAVGLIPLSIGVGLLVDAGIQKRDAERAAFAAQPPGQNTIC